MENGIPKDPAGRFAAIATRIPLEFSAISTRAVEQEMIQVEKHMRVCLSVRPGFTSAITVAASEPILAEAARDVMLEMNSPEELLKALRLSGMDKGDRGEMAAMLLLLLAYDKARRKAEKEAEEIRLPAVSLVSFLEALLCENAQGDTMKMTCTLAASEEAPKTLRDTFGRAKVYFTHFIRLDNFKLVNRQYFAGFMERGAAFICAVGNPGIDIGIPFMFDGDGPLERSNMGVILVQVKNDAGFTVSPRWELFELMNPFKINVFDAEEVSPVPIIRMVFALAASKGIVRAMGQRKRKLSKRKKLSKRIASKKFDTFDIWCGRACADSFGCISKEDEGIYEELLKLSYGFRIAFQIDKTTDLDENQVQEEVVRVTRSMHPCADIDENHWTWKEAKTVVSTDDAMDVDP
jgi:hypothetical protein